MATDFASAASFLSKMLFLFDINSPCFIVGRSYSQSGVVKFHVKQIQVSITVKYIHINRTIHESIKTVFKDKLVPSKAVFQVFRYDSRFIRWIFKLITVNEVIGTSRLKFEIFLPYLKQNQILQMSIKELVYVLHLWLKVTTWRVWAILEDWLCKILFWIYKNCSLFLILLGVLVVTLIGCMKFLSLFLDFIRMSMPTVFTS